MKKVVLISCVTKKLNRRARATDLYISPLFRLNMKYAQLLKPDEVFILSAKYGLISLEQEIEPYDLTLNRMSVADIKKWAVRVIDALRRVIDIEEDEVIFLTGEKYRKYLTPSIKYYKVPMKGMTIGKQLQFLSRIVNREKNAD